MCHVYLCAECDTTTSDPCSEASEFSTCPYFTQASDPAYRKCYSCILINGAIDELHFWLARHPTRAVSYNGPNTEEDSISVKQFNESDEEDAGTETAEKADTSLGCDSGVTLEDYNIRVIIKEKDEEIVAPVVLDAEK